MVVGVDVGLMVAGCSVDMVPGALALLLAKPGLQSYVRLI